MCRERAGWLMRRCSAARDTVPSSATATNVRRRLRSMSACLSPIRMSDQKTYVLDARRGAGHSVPHQGPHEEATHGQHMSLSGSATDEQGWVADVGGAPHRIVRGPARRPRRHHCRVEPDHCRDAAGGEGGDRPGPQPRLCDGARRDVRRRERHRAPLSPLRRRPRGGIRRVARRRGRRRRAHGARGALSAAPGDARRRAGGGVGPDPGRPGEDRWRGARRRGGKDDARAAPKRRDEREGPVCTGKRPGRIPAARERESDRRAVGGGDAVHAEEHTGVPLPGSAPAGERALRPGLQRGQGRGRAEQRATHGGADRHRDPVGAYEPDHVQRHAARHAGAQAEEHRRAGSGVCAAEHGWVGRAHRRAGGRSTGSCSGVRRRPFATRTPTATRRPPPIRPGRACAHRSPHTPNIPPVMRSSRAWRRRCCASSSVPIG